MRRWSATVLVCLLAVVMLGADSAKSATDASGRFGKVGGNLVCMCGCGQMLLQCNHVGCPTSGPMMDELKEQLAGPNGNGADSLILNWFVAKYGATVLAAPIRGGFDTVAWVVPLAVFAFAILGTGWMVKVWVGRRRVAVGGMTLPEMPMDDEMRARIRRDTEYPGGGQR